ncbi:MAG: NAD-dependent epimerase/dehydratase family protein [Gammaproteobacteria bacterium]|nr:NAD-dependent epimerase/dehydratase family protein [Gammaproteobacteria bacterium]
MNRVLKGDEPSFGPFVTLAAVSGASGFIGTALTPALAAQGIAVRPDARPDGQRLPLCGPALADWLRGADLVYHLAGIAHDKAAQAREADFTAVNQDLTLDLYRASAAAGVRTFVWLSSIKTLGDTAAAPLGVDAPRAPQGHYAHSKAQAELGLLRAHQAGGPPLAIVRPPLVYGPGVKGNFARLLKLCASPWPLPLADACARRSLLGLDNLVDLLIHLARAANPPTLIHVRDEEEWRTTDLVSDLRRLAGRPNRQFFVPASLVKAVARPLGLAATVSRLFDPLRVDAAPSMRSLGWRPPHSARELLEKTWRWAATQ